MRRVGLVFCGALLLAMAARPAAAFAAAEVTISTDRPSVADYSAVVPVGALQIESGLLATDSDGHYALDLPEAVLRYGLLPSTELRLTLPDYFHNFPGPDGTTSGFGDMAIGFKQRLGSLGGFDFLLIPSVSLPTGAEPISSHGYDPALQVPWSRSLTENWTMAGQLASYWPTVDGRRNHTAEATLLFDRQLTAPWDAFIEYAGDFPQRGGSRQLLHVGTAYRLEPHQQIDFHAAVGLSDAAARWYVGVGYSWLFPRP